MKIDPYYQRHKCSPGILVSIKIILCGYFYTVRWRGASNDESWVVENGDFRFSRSLSSEHFSLHTWQHDSFHVIRLSMTLAIFQGHWTVSHQISHKRDVIRQKLLWKSYTNFRLVPLCP